MWQRQGVDDGFFEFLDYVLKATDIGEPYRDVFRCNYFERYLVLVLVQNELVDSGSIVVTAFPNLPSCLFSQSLYSLEVRLGLDSSLFVLLTVWVD